MNTQPLHLGHLRSIIDGVWNDVATWMLQKPRVFSLAHPEQQIGFEYAARLREALRQASGQPRWDRLYFDASTLSVGTGAPAVMECRRPPIFVDTRRLFSIPDAAHRSALQPDLAVSIQVLRAPPVELTLDEAGRPTSQRWMPVSLAAQGHLLEQHVQELERLSGTGCDGTLWVVYSNETGRRTSVDLREVASWASWHQPVATLWWASRHFRARD